MPSPLARELRDQAVTIREVSLRLEFDEQVIKYYCVFCPSRDVLFATQGRIFGMSYGHHIDPTGFVIPVGFTCKKCGAIYFVNSFSG